MCNLAGLPPITGTHLETEQNMEPLAVSINAAAKALGVGRSSVYSLIKTGKLEAIKIGRRTLLTTASIKRLAQSHPAS
jgi:excisionase family DNA binding protein